VPVRPASGSGSASLTPVAGAGFAPDRPAAFINDTVAPEAGEPWVAVGSWADRPGGSLRPAVWMSPDGRSWSGGAIGRAAPFGHGDRVISSIAHRGGQFVAVGVDSTSGRLRPAEWTSTDGLSWKRVHLAHQLDPGRDDRQLVSVKAGALGYLAVLVDTASGASHSSIWRSSDGRDWQPMAGGTLPGANVFVSTTRQQGPIAIAVGEVNSGYDGDGAIWVSADGTRWEAANAPSLGGPGEQYVSSVAWMGQLFVAVGYETVNSTSHPLAWTSADGRSWARTSMPTPISPDTSARALAVTATPNGLLASGSAGPLMGLWKSSDGTRWDVADPPEELRHRVGHVDTTALAVAGDRVLLAETHQGGPGLWLDDPSGWAHVLSGPYTVPDPTHPWGGSVQSIAKGDDGYVAVGGAAEHRSLDGYRARGKVWTSPDGSAWTRLADKDVPFNRSFLAAVRFFNGRFVAAGYAYDKDFVRHTAVWTSTDGKQWDRVDEGAFAAVPVQRAATLAAGGLGLVLVATTRDPQGSGDLAVWTSGDGLNWIQAPADPAALGGDGEQEALDWCSKPGALVLVGDEEVGGVPRPVAWMSADGTHWTKTSVPLDGRQQGRANACLWTGQGLLAGGRSAGADDDGAFWSSPDGRSWNALPASAALGGTGYQAVYRVERIGSTLVAIGYDSALGQGRVALWRSVDGHTWSSVRSGTRNIGSLLGEAPNSSLVIGDSLFVVGSRGDAAQLWRGSVN